MAVFSRPSFFLKDDAGAGPTAESVHTDSILAKKPRRFRKPRGVKVLDLGVDNTMAKGDTPGHPFHGNQWLAGVTTNTKWAEAKGVMLESPFFHGTQSALNPGDIVTSAAQRGTTSRTGTSLTGAFATNSKDYASRMALGPNGQGHIYEVEPVEGPVVYNTSSTDSEYVALNGWRVKGEVVRKGDTPGHTFRGNQYSPGNGSSDSDTISPERNLQLAVRNWTEDTPNAYTQAAVVHDHAILTAALDNAPPANTWLLRGMGMTNVAPEYRDKWLKRVTSEFVPGATLDLPLTSFTTSPESEEQFERGGLPEHGPWSGHVEVDSAGNGTYIKHDNATRQKMQDDYMNARPYGVLIKVRPGARSISVDDIAPNDWSEAEHISGGKFHVDSADTDPKTGRLTVTLTQLDNHISQLHKSADDVWPFSKAAPWDESQHPRDKDGKFTSGGSAGPSDSASEDNTPNPPGWNPDAPPRVGLHPSHYMAPIGSKDNPVVVSSVVQAAQLLGQGKYIEFTQKRQVSTLLDRLNYLVQEAKSKGEDAPTYDLCKVAVTGSNLFCLESKGIPRIKMPQLSGKPLPNSRAALLPETASNPKGEADLSAQFRQHLISKGVTITDTPELASYLHASQNELNGAKVAGMSSAIEAGKLPPGRIFVSKDNYIVDGHHRWAANVGADARNGKLGDISMDVARIDMPIIQLLQEANDFAKKWGIPQAGVTKAVGLFTKSDGPICVDCAPPVYLFTKGDLPGHEFHGNQYTGSRGGKGNEAGLGGTGSMAQTATSWEKLNLEESIMTRLTNKYPRKPNEEVFAWQARVISHLPQSAKNDMMNAFRERYKPVDFVVAATTKWRQMHNLPEPQVDWQNVKADLTKGEKVAQAFTHLTNDTDPVTAAAYEDFKRQTNEMYDFMTKPINQGGMGIHVTIVPSDQEAYPSARAQADDVRNHRNINVQHDLGHGHALMTPEEYDHFRAVHDVFGHTGIGGGFDRHGEYAAWLLHNSMYTGLGRKAMSSEYHGSNNALWHGLDSHPRAGLLPDSLIANTFDDKGRLVRKGAMPEEDLSEEDIDKHDWTSDELVALGHRLGIDSDFVNRYDGGGGHINQSAKVRKNVTLFVKYDDSQPRDEHGRWTSGGDAPKLPAPSDTSLGARPITSEEVNSAGGDASSSRPVSAQEFQSLAATGASQLAKFHADSSPATGLDVQMGQRINDAYNETRNSWGGMTVDAHTGNRVDPKGDAYAITVKQPGQKTVTIPEDADKATFAAAMKEARARFDTNLSNAQHALGVFHNDEQHRIEFDPVLVVNSRAEVDTIGAQTHAIGGAYHFKSGNGFWPPHVEEKASVSKAAFNGSFDDYEGRDTQEGDDTDMGSDTGSEIIPDAVVSHAQWVAQHRPADDEVEEFTGDGSGGSDREGVGEPGYTEGLPDEDSADEGDEEDVDGESNTQPLP